MATLLKKARTILKKTETFPDGSECFEQELEEGDYMPRPIKSVFLSREMVAEMGDPDQITITVEPGDRLND